MTSQGGLYNGLTYEEVMSGHFKIRNKVIANVFSQMGLGESWGSVIRRILNAAEGYKLPVPKVEAFNDVFRVNLYRNIQDNGNNGSFGESGEENFGEKVVIGKDSQKVTDTQRKILECIADDKYISAKHIAEKIGVSGRTVENNIKFGYWEIVE